MVDQAPALTPEQQETVSRAIHAALGDGYRVVLVVATDAGSVGMIANMPTPMAYGLMEFVLESQAVTEQVGAFDVGRSDA